MPRPWENDVSILKQQVAPVALGFPATYLRNLIIDTLGLPLPLLAPSCAQRLATLSYTFAQSFSFNHLQAKSTCLKKRSKHRNSGRIPSLIGSLTPHRPGRPLRINFMSRYICFSQIGPFDVCFEELFSKVQNPGGFFRKIVF